MQAVHEYFTVWDWSVLFGYLLLTTWVGHLMRGKQASIKDFFAGGRSLPWQAVTGSIIATEISGVTFIGVPGGVMAAQGDFTYLIWGLGSIMGRIIVGKVFTKVFYEDHIYSPYDYMGRRIKPGLKTLATVFFTIGSILAQSVRLLVAAIPLMLVTGLSFELCILIIGVFAIIWTLMGGMRTVIWTDVMQFFLFTIGGLVAILWIAGHIEGGIFQIFKTAGEAGKTEWLDFRFGLGDAFQFTFWVAIIAVPFQNVAAFGVDQLNAQRMFCCKSPRDASKAIIWSSVGQGITYLMLVVGAALYVWYLQHPPQGLIAREMQWQADGTPGNGDAVFPIWIVTELPPGLSGLILGAIFAAAISSLDSILAALSQTTVSVLYHPDRLHNESDQVKMVRSSRMWVVFWGLFLTGFTLLMRWMKDEAEIPIIPLAFGMTAYTMGPLLGMFLCALIGKGTLRGLVIGSLLSLLLVLFVRTDVWILLHFIGMPYEWLSALPTYTVSGSGEDAKLTAVVGFHWAWPVTALITFVCGRFLFGSPPDAKGARQSA